MDWIKKSYDQAILLLVAIVLLGMSAWLFLSALNFSETFASIRGQVPHNTNVPPLDTTAIEQAKEAVDKPATWTSRPASLFVSSKYIVKDGRLINPRNSEEMLHPPVPNAWFFDHNLDILDGNVLSDDPDGDRFSNIDEFKAKTDPQDPNSHPPFVAKLRLVKAIQQPFRLLFNAYDGDPTKPESLSFQLNTVDVHQPTQFLKLNEQIARTKFKTVKFEQKKFTDANGVEKDVSELTVQNTETEDQVVLVLEKIVNSPDSFALFKYLWDGSQFPVKKDKTFSLKPEDVVYKLTSIMENEAIIENTKTGEKITVPKLEHP